MAEPFEGLALFVFDRHEVVLTGSEVLGAEEGEEVADTSFVDGVAVRMLIVALNGFGEFRLAGSANGCLR